MCRRVRRGSWFPALVHVRLQSYRFVNSQLRTVLVPASDEQRHTEGTRHDALLSLCTLTEPQCKIAYALCAALDGQRLGVVEVM
jgi:hypothetical protein